MVADVGPDDRCPCGSGKKFKRCRQEADGASSPNRVSSADGDERRATHALGRVDVEVMRRDLGL
jgi:hypothetical protein